MVQIIPYQPKHKEAFRSLNEAWITKYFKMEEIDIQSLGDPDGYILAKGGGIVVAEEGGEVLGVCALIPTAEPGIMELAKMAVAPEAQGKRIGFRLGQDILEMARSKGALKVVLESNTILEPAIRLYEKLGFKKIEGTESPYERCNIKMEILLN